MFNWSSTLPDTDVTRDPKVSTKINLTNPFNDLKMHRGVTIQTTIHMLYVIVKEIGDFQSKLALLPNIRIFCF